MSKLWVGTSGYRYWPGDIYPPKTSDADSLRLYAQALNTVELNRTFYRLPRATTIAQLQERVPKDFVWSVKIWRRISHDKQLRRIEADWTLFLDRLRPLLSLKGVLLLQLARRFPFDLPRLEHFLKRAPQDTRLAIEFRDAAWFTSSTYKLLEKYGAACVGVSAPNVPAKLDVRTATFSYYRLHGPREWYKGRYTLDELTPWIAAAEKALKKGPVYIYFDNTIGGHAYWNALEFKKQLSG